MKELVISIVENENGFPYLMVSQDQMFIPRMSKQHILYIYYYAWLSRHPVDVY